MSIILFSLNCISLHKVCLIKSCLINWEQLPLYFLLSSAKCHWSPLATNLDKKIKSCCSVDDRLFFNLKIYDFRMIQQTISQQCVLCWAKRELFAYPAMFPHLPEHLASRYVIFLCMCYHGT